MNRTEAKKHMNKLVMYEAYDNGAYVAELVELVEPAEEEQKWIRSKRVFWAMVRIRSVLRPPMPGWGGKKGPNPDLCIWKTEDTFQEYSIHRDFNGNIYPYEGEIIPYDESVIKSSYKVRDQIHRILMEPHRNDIHLDHEEKWIAGLYEDRDSLERAANEIALLAFQTQVKPIIEEAIHPSIPRLHNILRPILQEDTTITFIKVWKEGLEEKQTFSFFELLYESEQELSIGLENQVWIHIHKAVKCSIYYKEKNPSYVLYLEYKEIPFDIHLEFELIPCSIS
ncbi:hypothetical protein [Aneurinibacillus tyrosinisolvens]|uniref:hypothetical protein n=1 Tax=Aneurinibacillus tyrosinisolvens TaxID=1443435 RepID=UPI00063F2BF2|nr:hypothetical protein [Aneurinibacillus tyrosinisolvens]